MPDSLNLANLDYIDRVNRAVDYVMRNLHQPLRIEEVARAACFSEKAVATALCRRVTARRIRPDIAGRLQRIF